MFTFQQAVQPIVVYCCSVLTSVTTFDPVLFLKEASVDQLRCLLVDRGRVSEAEVKTLIAEQPKNRAKLKGVQFQLVVFCVVLK